MPEVVCAGRRWHVTHGDNLLDALNRAGLAVPFSCRAGKCQSCLVRCTQGEPQDARPDILDASRRGAGWRLACQCRVVEDLAVEVGAAAHLHSLVWLGDAVLRLRLITSRPLRYRVGQRLRLGSATHALASLPGEDPWLELHLDGRDADGYAALREGAAVPLGPLQDSALHYDPLWQARPLLLLAGGTGLAALWGILREALRQGHQGPIRLLHVAPEAYLAEPLRELAGRHANLQLEWLAPAHLAQRLPALRPTSRQDIALICGAPDFVEACAKRLFLAGLPGVQVLKACL